MHVREFLHKSLSDVYRGGHADQHLLGISSEVEAISSKCCCEQGRLGIRKSVNDPTLAGIANAPSFCPISMHHSGLHPDSAQNF